MELNNKEYASMLTAKFNEMPFHEQEKVVESVIQLYIGSTQLRKVNDELVKRIKELSDKD